MRQYILLLSTYFSSKNFATCFHGRHKMYFSCLPQFPSKYFLYLDNKHFTRNLNCKFIHPNPYSGLLNIYQGSGYQPKPYSGLLNIYQGSGYQPKPYSGLLNKTNTQGISLNLTPDYLKHTNTLLLITSQILPKLYSGYRYLSRNLTTGYLINTNTLLRVST